MNVSLTIETWASTSSLVCVVGTHIAVCVLTMRSTETKEAINRKILNMSQNGHWLP